MEKKRIEILLFMLLLFGGLIYGYYKYILVDQLETIKQYQDELVISKQNLNELNVINSDKIGTIKKISLLEQQSKILDKAIPDKFDSVQYNLEMYSMMKSKAVELRNLEPQGVTTSNGYGYQTVNMSISGSKAAIKDFIKYLQNNAEKYDIAETSIRLVNADEMEATLKVRTYFMKDQSNPS